MNPPTHAIAPAEEWTRRVTLDGRHVRLEPLAAGHARDLFEVSGPGTFRYFSVVPKSADVAGMEGFIEFLTSDAARVHFAVIERSTGRAVGSTSYYDIRPAHLGLEIGWTWYGDRVRATAVNPECKLLLMARAFEVLGAERVALRTDARNAHSRGAILKLGAKEEGIMRRHLLMPDGSWRDSVYFSVLREEWAGVRAGLERRVGAFSTGGVR